MIDVLSVRGIGLSGVFVYDELESTNVTAKEMAAGGAPHGTVVVADKQTAGRGRFGRGFFSPPGLGIYMSLVLRPENVAIDGFAADNAGLLTLFAAVSVSEAVEDLTGKRPGVKWVNDVILDGKKICGISTEAVSDERRVMWIILGIGVNFCAKADDFPEELRRIAGSVYMDGKAGVSRGVSRNQLIRGIAQRILRPGVCVGQDELVERYRRRLVMLGQKITVHGGGGAAPYSATALDIDSLGRLIVVKECGERAVLSAGEVSTKPTGNQEEMSE